MKFLIIGANAAGLSAASKARRNDPQAEITVLEKSADISYGACGLPYFVGGSIEHAEDLVAVTVETFRNKRNIDVLTHHEALSIDHRKRQVQVRDMESDSEKTFTYDKLVLATGAGAVHPNIPGKELKQIFFLRTLEDGKRIRAFCESEQPKQAVIIGAGYIGLEMAEAFVARGIQVRVVEAVDQVLPYLDADMAEKVSAHLREKGIELYLSAMVTALQGDGKVQQVLLADGRILDTDMVLMSVGIRPNVELARSAGVQLGRTGAIEVNDRMQTNLRNIYAAGDCCEARCRVVNKTTWVPLGTTANKQGKVAGDNISGGKSRFTGINSTSVVKVFDLEVAGTGLSSKIADRLGLTYKTVVVQSKSRAGYYPGPRKIWVKLLVEPESGKLLGAQMVGGEGVAKRIDVLATALYNRMTVQQISELDLSYSPPFAPVWDAVLVAANQALKLVRA